MTTLTYTMGALLWLGAALVPNDGDFLRKDGDMLGKAVPAISGPGDPNLVEGSFRIARGNHPELWIPPGEVLEFQVGIDLGFLGSATVGTVTMSSGVEPFVSGLPLPGQTQAGDGKMVGWVRTVARGGHLGYELDHAITTRFLPQEWPSILNAENQSGSEHRKKEVKIGRKDGVWSGSYRSNYHCQGCERREHFVTAVMPWNSDYHCEDCGRGEHRVWGEPTLREVPADTIDIIGAIYLARTLVREDLEELEFPLLQKSSLWNVKLSRGVTKDIESPAGTYRCLQVILDASQPEGEEGSKRFSGLFGINGSIFIWFHETSGVPVLIEGDVPLGGIITLHARVKLASALGTPASFEPR